MLFAYKKNVMKTDIFESCSPSGSIVHCIRKIFRKTSVIVTQLVDVVSRWVANASVSMLRCPEQCIADKFLLAPPTVSDGF